MTSRSRSSRRTCRTRSPPTACSREKIDHPLHLGITEAGTKWSGSLKSAVGLGTLLADGIGDTIRISLSTFHAEEEVKVAWEILKALQLRERGPVLIACPTCGRLQFDMDSVVMEIERRLEAYEDPIEVAVLGCAVNGIGEASHADFGITGAKNEGLIFSRGKALRKVPTAQLVDVLFEEIDKYATTKKIVVDERAAAEGAAWLEANEDATAMTPERLAAIEKAESEAQRRRRRRPGADRRRDLARRRAPLHPRRSRRRVCRSTPRGGGGGLDTRAPPRDARARRQRPQPLGQARRQHRRVVVRVDEGRAPLAGHRQRAGARRLEVAHRVDEDEIADRDPRGRAVLRAPLDRHAGRRAVGQQPRLAPQVVDRRAVGRVQAARLNARNGIAYALAAGLGCPVTP